MALFSIFNEHNLFLQTQYDCLDCPIVSRANLVDDVRSGPSAFCGREDKEFVVDIEIDLNCLDLDDQRTGFLVA